MKILSVKERLKNRLDEIIKNPKIRTVDLSGLELTSIPVELFELEELEELKISNNKIEYIDERIWNIDSLQLLDLSNNSISNIGQNIVNLKKLISLKIASNKIESLPLELFQLPELRYLILSDNEIKEVPSEIEALKNILVLFLDGNKISELPLNFQNLLFNLFRNNNSEDKENALNLRNNNFNIPEEIYDQGLQATVFYIINLQGNTSEFINEAKIIILGDGYAGKTALVEQMQYGTFRRSGDTTITRGISIEEISITVDNDVIKTKIWDFGGQEVMHAMHQFFMTERSLYILVWNAREDDPEGRIEDWIRLIQAFGGHSPIIIVINKIDDGNFHPDSEYLLEKYGDSIHGIVRTSCKLSKNGSQGISELKKKIATSFESLSYLKERIPFTWKIVKEKIEKHPENYISLSEYYSICYDNGVSNPDMQNSLLRLLHDLGIAFNYGNIDNPAATNILKPDWVTKGIYDIINSNRLFQSEGKLQLDDLEGILSPANEYPRSKYRVILGLMEQFELCFKINNQTYLVPDLLQMNQPHLSEEFDDGLKLEYHYRFLPKSVFPRFIVKVHDFSDSNWYWRYGIVLKKSYYANTLNKALVRVDRKEKKIYISVIGDNSNKRKLLSEIRSHFDILNLEIKNLQPQTYVPHDTNDEILESYEHLLTLEREGVYDFIPRGLDYKVSIYSFLKDVRRSKDYSNNEDSPEQVLKKFKDRNRKLELLTTERNTLIKKANKKANDVRIILYLLLIVMLSIIGYFSINNWDYWESRVTIGLTLVTLLASFLLKRFTPESIYKKLRTKKIEELYRIAKFDEQDYLDLSEAVDNLRKKINKYNS